jgi:hypothetical protein
MRASQWLLGLATTTAVMAAVASGCGGSASSGNSNDSGAQDVTTDHVEAAVEAAAEAGPEAASDACMSDAMLSGFPVYDGSIPGSDASAAVCLQCVEMACPNLPAECNAICGCPAQFLTFEACINGGGSLLDCGPDLEMTGLTETDVACAAACATTCGFTFGGDGGDGGNNNDGGDGSMGDAAEQ